MSTVHHNVSSPRRFDFNKGIQTLYTSSLSFIAS